jgi:hypothetical protein
MTRGRLDLRVVRRALRSEGAIVLIGESGGFDLRWVAPEQRHALWEQVCKNYRGPGGGPFGDYMGYEFVNEGGAHLRVPEALRALSGIDVGAFDLDPSAPPARRRPRPLLRLALVADASKTALLSTLNRLVIDLVGWLGDYPDDQVSPEALPTIKDAIDWVARRLPSEQRRRLAELAAAGPQSTVVADEVDTDVLEVVVGLLVDVMWWLDTCSDKEVDPDTAVKLLESAAGVLDRLPDSLNRRLLDILGELAAREQYAARRDQIRLFPFHTGLVEEQPDDEPSAGAWVHPAERLT